MIKEAEQFADEDKEVQRVDAKTAFDAYLGAMRSAASSGDNKGSEKT